MANITKISTAGVFILTLMSCSEDLDSRLKKFFLELDREIKDNYSCNSYAVDSLTSEYCAEDEKEFRDISIYKSKTTEPETIERCMEATKKLSKGYRYFYNCLISEKSAIDLFHKLDGAGTVNNKILVGPNFFIEGKKYWPLNSELSAIGCLGDGPIPAPVLASVEYNQIFAITGFSNYFSGRRFQIIPYCDEVIGLYSKDKNGYCKDLSPLMDLAINYCKSLTNN